MESHKDEKKSPVQASQDYSTRIFLFGLELIPYFAIPAIVGIFINKKVIEAYPDTNSLVTASIFFAMYVCSWIVVVMRFRSVRSRHKK